MGKGKNASGKHHTSKGERRSSISTASNDAGDRLMNQLRALMKGKNVVLSANVTANGKKLKVNGKKWLARHQGIKSADEKEEA